jgi:hypothetical protein
VQPHELPQLCTLGAGGPRQLTVHSPVPQITFMPWQASPAHSTRHGPSWQLTGTSPHASLPPLHTSVHA